MAPVTFPSKPYDLSGRTPIYRLTKNTPAATPTPIPRSQASSQPTPLNNPPLQQHQQGQKQHQTPYSTPYQSPYPSSQSVPEDAKAAALSQTAHENPDTEARNSPVTKRRGRKLQENEVLILVNCCLEFQSMYSDNRSRFWFCVATSLKRQIKRNFSWQSCRQIVEELVSERRDRRRDVAAGTSREQPLTELVLATDKWIAFNDTLEVRSHPTSTATHVPSPVQSLKRLAQPDSLTIEHTPGKRPKPQEQTTPVSVLAQPVAPVMVSPMPGGPTLTEFQSLKVDLQGARMDLQSVRREMQEMRHEMNAKLSLVLQALHEVRQLNESRKKMMTPSAGIED